MFEQYRTWKPEHWFAWALAIGGMVPIAKRLAKLWSDFRLCPNLDVLSWDANLRFLTVLDMWRDLRAGDLVFAVMPVFDAPTWPALRPVLSLLVFLANPGGPDPVADVGLTFFCFALGILSMLALAWRITPGSIGAIGVWACAVGGLFAAREIYAYALSAMLEVQGMLFALWVAFFLYGLYANRGGCSQTDSADGFVAKGTAIGLFVSIQGLVHTKYPYGVMLLIALGVLEIGRLVGSRAIRSLPVRVLFGGRARTVRLIVWGLYACLAFLALGAGEKAGAPAGVAGKLRNPFFAATLLIFIDANIALVRHRVLLRTTLPARLRAMYWTGLFPALAWMLAHPDRFRAMLGTREHSQDATRSFGLALVTEVFDPDAVAWFVLAGGAAFVVLLLVARFRGRRSLTTNENALLALLVLLALQFAVLEWTTPNKQLRHLYHLLPVALVLLGSCVVRLPGLLVPPVVATGQSPPGGWLRGTTAPGLLLIFGGIFFFPPADSGRPICFTGNDRAVVEPARIIAGAFPPEKPAVLLNLFHQLVTSDGTWPAGRYLATDLDLLLRMRSRATGVDLRQDSPRMKTWSGRSKLFVVADVCDGRYDALVVARAEKVGARVRRSADLPVTADGPICMERWMIY